MTEEDKEARTGVMYAITAFTAWGFLPIYWKLLHFLPALDILGHRMIWSLCFVLILLRVQKRWDEFKETLRNGKVMLILLLSATVIAINWFTYIWAVNDNRIVETSLGYYINPLVNVMIGVLFLKERLNRLEILASIIAASGVGYFLYQFGELPWVSLVLAFSFGIYGLLRKLAPVKPLVGLSIETALLCPLAVAVLTYRYVGEEQSLAVEWWQILLVLGTGVITALPLLWFAHAAKRIKLSTLGFLQYIGPSLALLVGVFLYDEPFTSTHLVTFGAIWCALAIFSLQNVFKNRRVHAKD